VNRDHRSPITDDQSQRPRSDFVGAIGAGGIAVLFCLILLWHDPLVFWNDDYELSILPVFADVARSWSQGEWPLLSPYSWVCGNLAGEFQYGTFSVFINAAVVLIWKLPLTFPQQAAALSIAHLFVLAMGGYLLARGRDLPPPLSLLVALVAALNGWIICWGATDWFGALGAFAWLPWAWWAMERSLDSRRSKWRFLCPAPFVYLVVTGGFPYTVVMLALVAFWLGCRAVASGEGGSIFPLLGGIILGLSLAAPAWLALVDYVQGSARAVQDSAEHFQWRVPFAALPGFIFPNWTVNWMDFSSRLMPHTATELASGFVPPVALIAGLVFLRGALFRRLGWELGLLAVTLILCMLPTAGVFRWSFRWLPLVHVVMALCAAESLQLFAESGLRFARSWVPAIVAFAALLGTYLWIPPNCGVPKYNLAQEMTQAAPLDPQRLYLSVYPAPESAYRLEERPKAFGAIVRPGSTSMWGAVRFVNGYSPIRPSGVAREFDSAIHGEISSTRASAFLQHANPATNYILSVLGVDGIIIANEIPEDPEPSSEWQLAVSTDEGRVFHRVGEALPQIRSLTRIDSRVNEQFTMADVSGVVARRNRLEADVSVPEGSVSAMLAVSRPFFRGYVARIGNRALKVDSFRGLSPVIEVPPGLSGRLVIVYRPGWLIWGGAMAIVSLLAMVACMIAAAAGRNRPAQ
jgi:hypothetical protein